MTTDLRTKIILAARKIPHSSKYAGFRVSAAGVYRIIQIANKKPYVAISASRSELSIEENKQRNIELLKQIKNAGYYAYELIGGYEEETEEGPVQVLETSYFVPFNDTNLDDFIAKFDRLRDAFDQDSFLLGLPEAYDYGDWQAPREDLIPGGHYYVSPSMAEKVGTKAEIHIFDEFGSIGLDPKKNRILEWRIGGVTTPGLSSSCYLMKRDGLKWFWDENKTSAKAFSNRAVVKKALERVINK